MNIYFACTYVSSVTVILQSECWKRHQDDNDTLYVLNLTINIKHYWFNTYANKNKIVNKEDIANLMNTYSCEVWDNLSKNIKQPSNRCVNLIVRNTKSIFIRPTNTAEICIIIKDLKEKAGGVDNINAKTRKQLLHT